MRDLPHRQSATVVRPMGMLLPSCREAERPAHEQRPVAVRRDANRVALTLPPGSPAARSAPPPRRRADGTPRSTSSSARAPHTMSAASAGSCCGEPACEVDRGDVLVHGVGHDVLVEEVGRAGAEAEPAQRRCRSGGWAIDEVISNSARCPTIAPAPAPVQPEQRHQVHGGQRHAGQSVEVGAVGRDRARARSIAAANSSAWIRSGRPPPYSSAWISTSAALGRPPEPRDRP